MRRASPEAAARPTLAIAISPKATTVPRPAGRTLDIGRAADAGLPYLLFVPEQNRTHDRESEDESKENGVEGAHGKGGVLLRRRSARCGSRRDRGYSEGALFEQLVVSTVGGDRYRFSGNGEKEVEEAETTQPRVVLEQAARGAKEFGFSTDPSAIFRAGRANRGPAVPAMSASAKLSNSLPKVASKLKLRRSGSRMDA